MSQPLSPPYQQTHTGNARQTDCKSDTQPLGTMYDIHPHWQQVVCCTQGRSTAVEQLIRSLHGTTELVEDLINGSHINGIAQTSKC